MTELWTCGHRANGMCAQCHRQLAFHASEITVENEMLRNAMRAVGDSRKLQHAHEIARRVMTAIAEKERAG